MKARRRKLIGQQKRRQFLKVVVPYFAIALTACLAMLLVGCAKPEKQKRDVSQYRVELGKKCLVKEDGSVAWSYVWIADQNVTLVKCK